MFFRKVIKLLILWSRINENPDGNDDGEDVDEDDANNRAADRFFNDRMVDNEDP